MPQMPSLGEPPRKSPVLPIAIAAIVVGSLSGALWWWTHRAQLAQPIAEAPTAPDAGEPAPLEVAAAPVDAGEPSDTGLKLLSVTLDGPLETCIISAAGQEVGPPLTQVVTRALVWWLRVPRDVMRGDALSALYEVREDQEPVLHAISFASQKLARTFEAYRYKSGDSTVSRLFQPDGTELEERLEGGPLDSYEQITSLLRDGRRHKGIDFKTPVGTPVRATFDGVISRKNWKFRSNGNCLEVSDGRGRTALFLHLSPLPKAINQGQRVKKGDVIAASGNSGRSFAPHLHYQLMRGSSVVDPFEQHPTFRKRMKDGERAEFEQALNALRAQLLGAKASGGG